MTSCVLCPANDFNLELQASCDLSSAAASPVTCAVVPVATVGTSLLYTLIYQDMDVQTHMTAYLSAFASNSK